MSNPLLDLQARLRQLILAHAYFAAVVDPPEDARPAVTVLTEAIADIDYQVNSGLLEAGFGVAIKTARGDTSSAGRSFDGSVDGRLDTREQFAIWIIHNPTADPTRNAVEGMWAAIEAVHGQPALGAPADPRGQEIFEVLNHQPADDAPDGVNVQVVVVSIRTRLL